MTSDDIRRMVREAGFRHVYVFNEGHLQIFANLVAAAEREACAKVCDELAAQSDLGDLWMEDCAQAIRARGAP